MIPDILLWTVENPKNSPYRLNLCVISNLIEDESLFHDILVKVEDLNYIVILALPPHLPSSELRFVSLECFSASLSDGVEPNNDQSGNLTSS